MRLLPSPLRQSPALGHRGRRLLSGAAIVSLALIAVACGSSGKSGSSTTTAAGSSATTGGAATGAPLKIGVICSCSGTLAAGDVPKEDVYKSWANTVNASGGIAGHQVQLIAMDDGANPGTSLSDVQQMISDHVVAILDITNLDVTWASVVQQAGIPVVGGNLFDAPFYTNPDFFAEGQTEDAANYSVAATAKTAGATNLSIFYCAEAAACQQTVPLIKTSAQQVGLPLIYSAEVSSTAPNYTAQCVAAEQDHVTAIFIADVPDVVGRIGQDCDRQGYKNLYVTEGSSYNSSQPSTPGLKDHMWSAFADLPYYSTSSEVQAMNTAVDKYYPGLRNQVNSWSELAALEWPSGLLLADGAKAGGLTPSATPTAAEITKGLEALHGDTLQGWAPPLTFPAGKPHPIDCWFTARVQNGTPSLVNNGRVSCESGSQS